MDRVLAPAAAVLRKLSFTGKFSVIAVVLLVPLLISLTGVFVSAAEQVRIARSELDGLTYVDPVIRLSVQLDRLHDAVINGDDTTGVQLTTIAEIDDVDARLGEELGLHSDWRAVRDRLAKLTATAHDTTLNPDGAGPSTIQSSGRERRLADAAELRLVAGRVRDLAVAAGTSSHLLLDGEVDSHHVTATLVSHLPDLLDATAQTRESLLRRSDTDDLSNGSADSAATIPYAAGPDPTVPDPDDDPVDPGVAGEATPPLPNVAQHELNASATRISVAMRQAWSSASDDRVRQATQPAWATMDAQARSLATAISDPTADVPAATAAFLDSVPPFAMSLSSTTGMLLRERIAELERDRTLPLVLCLVAFLLASYLFAALFRSTSQDARAVLSEINSVAEGAIYQNQPLAGRDEFAQMSQAAVIARDRLTSLLGELRFQATHDDLTALGNRTLLREKLEEVLADALPEEEVALAFLDLDGFADVNDSFGHDIGDQVLRTVGARFHHAIRRQDVVVRLGSDDFAVLLPQVSGEREVTDIVRRVQATLDEPIVVGGRRLRLRANAGVALAVAGATSAAELQRDADVAKYAARERGTGEPAYFEPWLHERTAERAELSADFAQAIQGDQLEVVYQPIVDLHTGAAHGAEALVRWHHPTRGLIMPDVFVPLAEATGSIGALTGWVLRESATQARAWRDRFPDGYPLSMDVNISAMQLGDDRILADLVSIIEETGVDPSGLVLEITESALVSDIETAQRRLRQIAAIGVRLALDDFGTGYSSLSHLRHLPISVLKIDKSFVTSVSLPDADDAGGSMLRGIVSLGSSLGMQIVAEGVETGHQADLLRRAGCHLGQGYRYSSPLTAAEFGRALDASQESGRWPRGESGSRHAVPAPRTDSSDVRQA